MQGPFPLTSHWQRRRKTNYATYRRDIRPNEAAYGLRLKAYIMLLSGRASPEMCPGEIQEARRGEGRI
uniref:Uncharacterized protein n=1 Tax=Leersia perrieri TaxID=77586 RepID=A0A0D9XEM0_9ORYZ